MKIVFSELVPVAEIGNDIADGFAAGASYVHIHGLPIPGMGELQRNAFITDIASTIGKLTLTGNKPGSELWKLNSTTSPNASQIPFHTDNPFYENPEEVVSFWNIRSSAEGGENIILPVTSMLEWMDARPQYAELLEELTTTDIPFRLNGSQTTQVLLQPETGTARYDQKYIDPAYTELGIRFTQVLSKARVLAHEIKLSESEALFFNNHTTLHARAPYSDPDRLSIRVRIAQS